MNANERILIAIDDSPASAKAVSYLGRLLGGAGGHTIRLFHVVEPIGPTWLSRHGTLKTDSGAPPGDPETLFIEEAKKRARPVLEKMRAVLTGAGIEGDRIESTWFVASREDSLTEEILQLAREQRYLTVVVGRTALPWYRELFRQHVGEKLVKKGEGLSVWVIE